MESEYPLTLWNALLFGYIRLIIIHSFCFPQNTHPDPVWYPSHLPHLYGEVVSFDESMTSSDIVIIFCFIFQAYLRKCPKMHLRRHFVESCENDAFPISSSKSMFGKMIYFLINKWSLCLGDIRPFSLGVSVTYIQYIDTSLHFFRDGAVVIPLHSKPRHPLSSSPLTEDRRKP